MLSPNPDAALREYRQIATQSSIEDASPHRLIQLMMERALEKIRLARAQMQDGLVAEKGSNIGDAIGIINGLQASLNHSADERLSENFDALYAYMMRQLLAANLHNDDAKLEEVAGLLGELKEAWDAIADQVEGD